MSEDSNSPKDLLLDAIESALALLDDRAEARFSRFPIAQDETAEPLPNLLERCEALCDSAAARADEPVRMLHHFACTGGTLIARCLAALPNCIVMNEIDPLSKLHLQSERKPFLPTDLIADIRYWRNPLDDEAVAEVFRAALTEIHSQVNLVGGRLILRDHAHSHYCTRSDATSRSTTLRIVEDASTVISLLTTRHPLDSFIGLQVNDWRHFDPFTLQEYSLRYMEFLDDHSGVPRISYENFVADPEVELQRMCSVLQLPFTPDALKNFSAVVLSGDSGRRGDVILERPRRPVSEELVSSANHSENYHALCARLGYDPDPTAKPSRDAKIKAGWQ
ncbi:sulfotransferase [Roseivivax isoporae]|uniref:sulfotransferase n=1 Tax=Roseivivax isoporae TaxID=591206 RepID=UPI0012EB94EF|nr:sulfotransferase [Roseivivax isoporae]